MMVGEAAGLVDPGELDPDNAEALYTLATTLFEFDRNWEEAERLFESTVQYWRRWVSHCTYTGRWREAVHRSVLALKLMTFEPTGAALADTLLLSGPFGVRAVTVDPWTGDVRVY